LEVRSKEDLYITRATDIKKQIQKLYLKGNGCHKYKIAVITSALLAASSAAFLTGTSELSSVSSSILKPRCK